jgi:hypothetical protein
MKNPGAGGRQNVKSSDSLSKMNEIILRFARTLSKTYLMAKSKSVSIVPDEMGGVKYYLSGIEK